MLDYNLHCTVKCEMLLYKLLTAVVFKHTMLLPCNGRAHVLHMMEGCDRTCLILLTVPSAPSIYSKIIYTQEIIIMFYIFLSLANNSMNSKQSKKRMSPTQCWGPMFVGPTVAMATVTTCLGQSCVYSSGGNTDLVTEHRCTITDLAKLLKSLTLISSPFVTSIKH